jgi:rRNA maturation endonuclease Nob1
MVEIAVVLGRRSVRGSEPQQEVSKPKELICPHCEKVLSQPMLFCEHCGKSIA